MFHDSCPPHGVPEGSGLPSGLGTQVGLLHEGRRATCGPGEAAGSAQNDHPPPTCALAQGMHLGSQGGRPWRGGQGGGQQPRAAGVRSPGQASWQSARSPSPRRGARLASTSPSSSPGEAPEGPDSSITPRRGTQSLSDLTCPRGAPHFQSPHPRPTEPSVISGWASTPPWSPWSRGWHVSLEHRRLGGRDPSGSGQSWAWTTGSPVPRALPTPAGAGSRAPPPDPLCWTRGPLAKRGHA